METPVLTSLRGHRLTATVAALFVLQAPLCALACLPESGTAIMAESAGGAPPCHEPAEAPEKSEPHDDCGCADSSAALLPLSAKEAAAAHFVVAPSMAALALPHRVIRRTPHTLLTETDLPPPDILLRKSTLLI